MDKREEKILVIDDSPSVREMYATALRSSGYGVVPAKSGTEALKLIGRHKFDLVILDLMMPGLNGFELCRILKKDARTFNIPIIVATVLSGTDPEVFAIESGADDFIIKPFDSTILIARTKMVLRRHKQTLTQNPLTGLMGSVGIEQALEMRLAANSIFSVCATDLDNLKAYNEQYGYEQGDYVIKFVAAILVEAVRYHGNETDFVGHFGGDDFIFMTTTDKLDFIADYIIQKFEKLVVLHYPEDVQQNGYYSRFDRRGQEHQIPVMTISVGSVSNDHREFTSVHQILDITRELIQYAKMFKGSNHKRDRRKNNLPLTDESETSDEAADDNHKDTAGNPEEK